MIDRQPRLVVSDASDVGWGRNGVGGGTTTAIPGQVDPWVAAAAHYGAGSSGAVEITAVRAALRC